MSRSSQSKKPVAGDLLVVPSPYGVFYLAQLADVSLEIGSLAMFFFDVCVEEIEELRSLNPDALRIISASLITPELVRRGQWKVLRSSPVRPHEFLHELNRLKDEGYVGAVIVGAGLALNYLDTYFGYKRATEWPDIKYVQDFFEPGVFDVDGRPSNAH